MPTIIELADPSGLTVRPLTDVALWSAPTTAEVCKIAVVTALSEMGVRASEIAYAAQSLAPRLEARGYTQGEVCYAAYELVACPEWGKDRQYRGNEGAPLELWRFEKIIRRLRKLQAKVYSDPPMLHTLAAVQDLVAEWPEILDRKDFTKREENGFGEPLYAYLPGLQANAKKRGAA